MRKSKKTPEQRRDDWVRNQLRRITIKWPPAHEAKKAARVGRLINPASGRLAWHSTCALCSIVKPESKTELDHVSPIVPLKGGIKQKNNPDRIDWNLYVDRALPFKEGWRVLCKDCHLKTTNEQREMRADDRKTKKSNKIS